MGTLRVMLPPDMNLEPRDDSRHRPDRAPSERDLFALRKQLEKGSYEVRPTDVAEAILSGGGLLGFRLPRSVRQG